MIFSIAVPGAKFCWNENSWRIALGVANVWIGATAGKPDRYTSNPKNNPKRKTRQPNHRGLAIHYFIV
jgi:hypothetical protein